MFARLTTALIEMNKLDEAIKLFKDSVVPAAKSQKGYQGTYVLTDAKIGKAIIITLWSSEADAAAQEWVTEERGYYNEQLAKFKEYFVEGTPPTHEGYDVSIQDFA